MVLWADLWVLACGAAACCFFLAVYSLRVMLAFGAAACCFFLSVYSFRVSRVAFGAACVSEYGRDEVHEALQAWVGSVSHTRGGGRGTCAELAGCCKHVITGARGVWVSGCWLLDDF
jgi:hypothetical protein